MPPFSLFLSLRLTFICSIGDGVRIRIVEPVLDRCADGPIRFHSSHSVLRCYLRRTLSRADQRPEVPGISVLLVLLLISLRSVLDIRGTPLQLIGL